MSVIRLPLSRYVKFAITSLLDSRLGKDLQEAKKKRIGNSLNKTCIIVLLHGTITISVPIDSISKSPHSIICMVSSSAETTCVIVSHLRNLFLKFSSCLSTHIILIKM